MPHYSTFFIMCHFRNSFKKKKSCNIALKKGKGSLISISHIHIPRHFRMPISSFSLAISQALLEVLLSCMFIGTQNPIKQKIYTCLLVRLSFSYSGESLKKMKRH